MPFLSFGDRQGIQIEQDLPLRSIGEIGLPGCAPPKSQTVFRVAPEVVVVLAAFCDHRDAVLGIENRLDVLDLSAERVIVELVFSPLRLLAYPIQGSFVAGPFQP
ncbi:hypothetical protein D3C74_344760 [compost metagenome]